MITRDKLIQATIELVADNGLYDVPTSKIAKKAQYSEATIYKHFKSKVELLIEAYLNIKSNVDRTLFIHVEGITDPTKKYYKIWSNYLEYFVNHPKELSYYQQFSHSTYMNHIIIERGKEQLSSLTNYLTENIESGFFRDLPISFYYAYAYVPVLELANSIVNAEIQLTDQLKEEAIQCTLRVILNR
ncbi:TetR/AcrR family transcriptional regulator [Vallitalea pronyensis]|uniref:TetR/AcrR family transcriptional regulator n=1 Tax=Vallitalea pronyensis TaxID=1348613 RepID=A0A8J8MKW6_9FIRM|nr:TetR/AcrR family transcriptional regulator [Vallitalea pronyensis]QUI23386.1 TetR/AcrR family transcriptional regulator [Vallitalea pronyensis]